MNSKSNKKKSYRRGLSFFLLVVLIMSLVVLEGCHEKYDLEQLAKEDAEANPQQYADTADLESEDQDVDTTDDVETSETETGSDSQDSDADTEDSSTDDSESTAGAPPSSILGNTTDTSYSNSYFGIKFNAPSDNWYIASDGELAQVMGIATSSIEDQDILDMLQDSGFVMDLYALDTTGSEGNITFDNINITIEDIGKMYGVLLSEQELAESTLSASKQALEAQGWTNVDMEVTETVFAGSPRTCTVSSSEMDGQTMYQKQVYIKKESYIACITVASFDEDRTDSMLNAFSAL